jgi:pimeloyl-ACP methyl ester carboxylesterase
MDVSSSTGQIATVRLPDDRRLAYSEGGDPAGTPVVLCHGWLASRLACHPDDATTAALGVRLVTVDRPGIGQSDRDPGKSLLSVAADIEALADRLELARFHVLGHSGGGPYALALAHRLPDRVARVAVASGFAPFDRPDAYAGMTPRMRGFVRLLRRAPWLAGVFLAGAPRRFRTDPEKAFAKQFGELCEADATALEDPALHAVLLDSAVESLAGGSAGVALESQLLFVRSWGFSPATVRCPVDLWYGDADTIVPVEMGRHLAQTLPDSRLTVVPGGGHTLVLTRWTDILRALVA